MNKKCPCCSGKQFTDCCQPLHKNKKVAQSPKQLMRSRYCAFAENEVDYLMRTTDSALRKQLSKVEINQWSVENDWQRLEIIRSEEKGNKGLVEFKAYFKSALGKEEIHHELSAFVKEKGVWFYASGEINPKEVHRNAPCPCGSGKKYKKCCGLN